MCKGYGLWYNVKRKIISGITVHLVYILYVFYNTYLLIIIIYLLIIIIYLFINIHALQDS